MMTAQNIYDDPDFLAGYEKLDRQVCGLNGAAEWPTLRSMLPDLAGRRVVDFGCGFGWFSRWAGQQGATQVIGIDASTKMLERARNETNSPTIEYRCEDLDALDLAPDSTDMAFSSHTLHYLNGLDRFFSMVAQAIVPGGLDRMVEWGPTAEEVEAHPERADDRHRPWFLLMRATRRNA